MGGLGGVPGRCEEYVVVCVWTYVFSSGRLVYVLVWLWMSFPLPLEYPTCFEGT